MIFVDTGYFLALLNPRDGLHQRAQAWEQETTEILLTTSGVVTEVLDAMASPQHRELATAVMRGVLGGSGFHVEPMDEVTFGLALERYARRPDQAWGLTDCASFVVMEEHGVTRALAHDHHFEQAGFEALLRRDP